MPAGRPKKTIDWNTFEELMKIGCTENEVCSVLGVTDKTLNRLIEEREGVKFSDIIKSEKYLGKMKASLRRAQFKSALGGNTTMLIWLGKQYLGQTEKIEQEETGDRTIHTHIHWEKADEAQTKQHG